MHGNTVIIELSIAAMSGITCSVIHRYLKLSKVKPVVS